MDIPFSDLAFSAIQVGKLPSSRALARKSYETWETSYDRLPNHEGPPSVRRLRVPSGLAPINQTSCHAIMSLLITNPMVSPGFASHTNVVQACSLVVGSTDTRSGTFPPYSG